jgi:acetylornithine deacetylase/succinyl-diaminopimelate desuccinylase-like protein
MNKIPGEYKRILNDFLKFKSISTDPAYSEELQNTALWLENIFIRNGFKTQIWGSKNANPVVFADYSLPKTNNSPSQTSGSESHPVLRRLSRAGGQQPATILIYGHYDVQPASVSDGWKSDPFSLSEDKERFYGRGVIDNKGQVLVHIATIFELIKTNKLTSNVKFMIEGNEETGNDSLSKLMNKHKKNLACNYVLVSDGELTNNKPSVEVSLRGGFNCTLTYKTGKNNLHSGVWGGAVPNAPYELCRFLAGIYKSDGTINIKGFYEGVDDITYEEARNNRRLMKQTSDLPKLAGVSRLVMKKGQDFFTATGLKPTIQITGFRSGYTDVGYSNIVPAEAEVRLNIRTVASQKIKIIMKCIEKHIRENTPEYVRYKLEFNNPHEPVKVSVQNKYLKNIENILEKVYKQKVNKRNVGGAIPFVADVKAILGVDPVLVPLVNEDCNMHGANENFNKKYLEKALEFSYDLFSY